MACLSSRRIERQLNGHLETRTGTWDGGVHMDLRLVDTKGCVNEMNQQTDVYGRLGDLLLRPGGPGWDYVHAG